MLELVFVYNFRSKNYSGERKAYG